MQCNKPSGVLFNGQPCWSHLSEPEINFGLYTSRGKSIKPFNVAQMAYGFVDPKAKSF